jgi:LEA14-like dessication related protein
MGYREGDIKVTISSLTLLEATLMEQRYLVGLRLQNRSPNRLQIGGMSFDVELNGKDFASGVSNRRLSVAPFEEASLEVEVGSSLFSMIRQLQVLQQQQRKAFDYKISGRVYLGQGLFSLPFKETGVIDLVGPGPAGHDRI